MAWNEPGGEKRDPWNRPHQQQNDFDDMLRNIQRRLSALFGRGGAGGGPADRTSAWVWWVS
jgi:modulator of FtsH protease HflK